MVTAVRHVYCFLCNKKLYYQISSSAYDPTGEPLKADTYVSDISGLGNPALYTIRCWRTEAGSAPFMLEKFCFVTNPERGGYFVPNFGGSADNDILVCEDCVDKFVTNKVGGLENLKNEIYKAFLTKLADDFVALFTMLYSFGISNSTLYRQSQALTPEQKTGIQYSLLYLRSQMRVLRTTDKVQRTLVMLDLLDALFQ